MIVSNVFRALTLAAACALTAALSGCAGAPDCPSTGPSSSSEISQPAVLQDSAFYRPVVEVAGALYFADGANDYHLYKLKDGALTEVVAEPVHSFFASRDFLFYAVADGLFRSDLEGGGAELVAEFPSQIDLHAASYLNFCLGGDFLYFTYQNAYYRCDADGHGLEKIGSGPDILRLNTVWSECAVVSADEDGVVFFDEDSICRLTPNANRTPLFSAPDGLTIQSATRVGREYLAALYSDSDHTLRLIRCDEAGRQLEETPAFSAENFESGCFYEETYYAVLGDHLVSADAAQGFSTVATLPDFRAEIRPDTKAAGLYIGKLFSGENRLLYLKQSFYDSKQFCIQSIPLGAGEVETVVQRIG